MTHVAILSFAHYHANFWTEQFVEMREIDVPCIWDADAARGEEAASRFGLRYVRDIDKAIALADAVAICSETRQHLPLTQKAAAAGRAILCEKPTARNLAEVDAMAEAVRDSGVLFMQSFPKRLDAASQALRKLVEDDALGRIHTVRVRHGHFYGLDAAFRGGWLCRREEAGGGALMDEGVHGADLLCRLFGLPQSVICTTSDGVLGMEVEENATAVFSWANGMTAELTASFLFNAASDSVELYGTRGTALLAGVDLASRDITPGPFLRVWTGGERIWRIDDMVPQFKRGRFHHQNAIAFARCLTEGAPPPATIEDGRRAQLLIERAYAAAATGQRQVIA